MLLGNGDFAFHISLPDLGRADFVREVLGFNGDGRQKSASGLPSGTASWAFMPWLVAPPKSAASPLLKMRLNS